MTAGKTRGFNYRDLDGRNKGRSRERAFQNPQSTDLPEKPATRPSKKSTLAIVHRIALRSFLISAYLAQHAKPGKDVGAFRDAGGKPYITGAKSVASYIVSVAFPPNLQSHSYVAAVETWLHDPARSDFPYLKRLLPFAMFGNAPVEANTILKKIINSYAYR